ncbi:MAG TPA: hypothetical protein VGP47_01305 [Parachlamydiaceae bacterium]|nr:hypothetical protein [Parachlamydiaceae bacterium]
MITSANYLALPTLWDQNESLRDCIKNMDTYLSECDSESILSYPEVFLAACCKKSGRHYMNTILSQALKEFVDDLEKIRNLLYESFYSRENFKIYVIKDISKPGNHYLLKQSGDYPIKLADQTCAVIFNYEQILPILEKISKICGLSLTKTSKVLRQREEIKFRNKQRMDILEFQWDPLKYSELIFGPPAYHDYTEHLNKNGFYCNVLSKDKKVLSIHGKLFPNEVDFNDDEQIVTFEKYTAKTLEAFFESLYLTPSEFIYKHSQVYVFELLELAHEYDHAVLMEICIWMICNIATPQDMQKILNANLIYQNDTLRALCERLRNSNANQEVLCCTNQ